MKQSAKAAADFVGVKFDSKTWYLGSRLGDELGVSCKYGNVQELPLDTRKRADDWDIFTACFSPTKRPSSSTNLLNQGSCSREWSLLQLDDRNSLRVISGGSSES